MKFYRATIEVITIGEDRSDAIRNIKKGGMVMDDLLEGPKEDNWEQFKDDPERQKYYMDKFRREINARINTR